MTDTICEAIIIAGKNKGNRCKCKAKYERGNRSYCGMHKTDNISICKEKGCNEKSRYSYDGETHLRFCREHMNPGMIDFYNKLCEQEGCKVQAHFNFVDKMKASHCVSHKHDGMRNVKFNKICKDKVCKVQASFNFEGKKIPSYCESHKDNNMVDVVNINCEAINVRGENKNKRCSFKGNFRRDGKAYCGTHKDLLIYICRHDNCNKVPSFNHKGEEKALYCLQHKDNTMVNVINKKCNHINCDKIPSFNYKGEEKALYCHSHKDDNMVDIVHRKCEHPSCTKNPSFNYKGEKRPLFCSTHKTNTMINVMSKRCIEDGCDKCSVFNYKGKKRALYCFLHHKDNMVNVVSKRCNSEFCDTITRQSYDGYCSHCFFHLFPNNIKARNHKTKEKDVTNYIVERFPDVDWVTDKSIKDGCSKKRPDIFLDLGYHCLIVEIDELQHRGYDKSCENKRLVQLSIDLGHRDLVMIRFNPDNYDNTKSPWSKSRTGKLSISNTDEWNIRLNHLGDRIEHYMKEGSCKKLIHTEKLFFDIVE